MIHSVPCKSAFRNSQKFFKTILRSSHRTCSIKSFFQTFQDIRRKTPLLGLFLNKVAGHQSCNFIKTWIKKRLQEIFLVIIQKLTITPNLKNICEQLHWRDICKNIFQIRTQQRKLLTKKSVHLQCERLLKLVKIEQKCFLS